jgi:hypothetical protein
MMLKRGNKKASDNPWRYVYSKPDPDDPEIQFVGRYKCINGRDVLEPNPPIQGDAKTRLVAISEN